MPDFQLFVTPSILALVASIFVSNTCSAIVLCQISSDALVSAIVVLQFEMFRFFRLNRRIVRALSTNAAPSEIMSEIKGGMGFITLNRPTALNSLTLFMAKQIVEIMGQWQSSPVMPRAFIMTGNGKAFCAGGDVKAIWNDANSQGAKAGLGTSGILSSDFFREEYKMNYKLFTSPIPQISIWNGIVMGGGVGVSIYGKYRIATENTRFAMPETSIGFFPDVGSTYWLSGLDNNTIWNPPHEHFGLHLGLTGVTLSGSEATSLGLATHFVPSDQ